ncbi:acyl-CoA thioesterase YbgC [Polystyrenella longa]|uniref:Acyl-CoA thioesterase YbgC n=1 Tax=Polystyrenella longa TaxID=2528007 RepID=A0A518CPG6_9PLAN|nr:thioesterase family protein [Polystyrenella longa]QDU81112.1 acyl-CoA thioesterase YbgC [Polystyrenella longa]
MALIYEHHLTVPPDAIDGQGHVNNVVYLNWMQDAAVAHSSAQGWTNARYKETGFSWVVRTHTIEYLREAFLNEEITVRTWIANMKKVTSLRRYEIVRDRDEAILAKAATNFAFINRKTAKIMRVPPELINSFEIVPDQT